MWKLNLKIVVAFCMFIIALREPAADGATIHVPADFNSIQVAIDDANDGDEIEVAPGIYNEAIDCNGKAVKVVFTPSAKRTFSTSPSHKNYPRDAVWASPRTFLAYPSTHDHANPRIRSPPSNAKHL